MIHDGSSIALRRRQRTTSTGTASLKLNRDPLGRNQLQGQVFDVVRWPVAGGLPIPEPR
jgi:hypothetical protein